MNPVYGQVGPDIAGDGAELPLRLGRLSDLIVSELQGRFYEAAARGQLFSGGMTTTSISAATFTTATTGATATPILGVYNPVGSGKILTLLQAILNVTVTAGVATGPGTFQWVISASGQNGLTLGSAPWNRGSLVQTGSVAKNMAGVALTGLAGVLAILGGSALYGGLLKNTSSTETAVGQNIGMAGISVENLDGNLLVPPGFFAGLFCTTTPVAHSAGSNLIWSENPV